MVAVSVAEITVGHRTFSEHLSTLSDQTSMCSVKMSSHQNVQPLKYHMIPARELLVQYTVHVRVDSLYCNAMYGEVPSLQYRDMHSYL